MNVKATGSLVQCIFIYSMQSGKASTEGNENILLPAQNSLDPAGWDTLPEVGEKSLNPLRQKRKINYISYDNGQCFGI